MVAGQRVAHEIFWAITDDGDRYRHLTPAQALSHLLAVGKPGKIMCENHIDPSLPGKTLVFAATDLHADMLVRLEAARAALGVVLTFAEGFSTERLFATLPGYPSITADKRAIERRDFADAAAELALRDAVIKSVFAMRRDVGGDVLFIRTLDFDRDTVLCLHLADQRERFIVQAAGIQSEDFDWQAEPRDSVGDHHVFG